MSTPSDKLPTPSDDIASGQTGSGQAEPDNNAHGLRTASDERDVERVIKAFVQALQVVKPAK